MAFKIGKYVINYLQNNEEAISKLSDTAIAKKMVQEDKFIENLYDGRLNTLIRTINRIRTTDSTNVEAKVGNQPPEFKTPYKVIDDKYFFFPVKGEFSLPIELVDDLFHDFSKHGLDLSTTEIMLKYNLEPWQWHALKNALRLYKTSHIFSPFTTSNLKPEELTQVIKEKMDQKVNTVSFRVEQQYNQSTIRKYKEVIAKDALRELEVKTIINEVADYLIEARIEPVKSVSAKATGGEINVVIADLHFGAKNTKRHLPDYSVEILKDHFRTQIVPIINSYNAKKVNIFLAGDLIESFTGLNHVDSWKGIQEGYYGADLVKYCYEFLVEFISSVNNVDKVIGVSGNHDRATPNKDHDNEGFIAQIIFEFLRLSFKNVDIKVIFDNKLESLLIDDICYIMSHGHEKLSDGNASTLVLKYGSQNHYNVLISGHWHERRIKADSEKFRQIVCPSVFPGNNFSVGLGYDTCAGFLIIENNGKGRAIVHDYPL